jgi:hypothetical protein
MMKVFLMRGHRYVRNIFYFFALLIGIIILAYLVLMFAIKPSLNRNWTVDQAVLPTATWNGSEVTIKNVRNFVYQTVDTYTPTYDNRTFDLTKLSSMWFAVEPFSGYKGAAHTLVSFGFDDGRYLAISVEIRKEKGEQFSALKGLLRQYELMYVIADENDVIKLRTNYRKDNVYLYPIKTTKENIRTIFTDMVNRANTLAQKPEFYNTLTNTCTTNIVSHVNKINPGKVPWKTSILFPADSDHYAYELGLIDTKLSFEEAREYFHINEQAVRFADDPNFSKKIREEMPSP